MDRTKRKKEWFIKDVGRGSFRLPSGKKVKPNEKFLAFEEEIPEAHRDLVHKLDGSDYGKGVQAEVEEKDQEATEKTGQYYKGERQNAPGWYDVYDPQGKVVNENAVRESEADQWVESLNA